MEGRCELDAGDEVLQVDATAGMQGLLFCESASSKRRETMSSQRKLDARLAETADSVGDGLG